MAGARTQDIAILVILIIAALNSVLSLGYYAPLINQMYRRQPAAIVANGRAVPLAMTVPLVLLAVGIVVLGVLPMLANWLTVPAAADLINAFIR